MKRGTILALQLVGVTVVLTFGVSWAALLYLADYYPGLVCPTRNP